MEADIRKFKPLREGVHHGLTTLLVQARQIWGHPSHTPTIDEIVVRLTAAIGHLAHLACDGSALDRAVYAQLLKRELGNVLFSTIRWIDDLGLDPLECLDLAIEAQEKFAKSGRPR